MDSYHFRWDVVWTNLPFLLSGLEQTLLISVLTLVASALLGMVIALADMSPLRLVRFPSYAVGEIVRNTPILVQLLWVYYVLPIVFNISIDSFTACVIGLTLYSSAFIAEIYRAGIQGVPRGHREAAQVLGLSPLDAFVRIVLPQALAGDPAAAGGQLRAAHQVLFPRRRHLGLGGDAARHGAVVFHVPAAGDLHLHRRDLLPHLLAAGPSHPLLGETPCRTLTWPHGAPPAMPSWPTPGRGGTRWWPTPAR